MDDRQRVSPAGRAAYALAQTTRVGWFVGQALLARRLYGGQEGERGPRDDQSALMIRGLLRELRALMRQDLRNIAAGLYRMPAPLPESPRQALAGSVRFFRDFPKVQARRHRGGNAEVFRAPPPGSERLPRYYRQNFHFQTDGWLSADSAALYDHQVEVLFGGGADAMRRQALVPLAALFRERPVRGARLLDVGAGTGRFLRAVKENYPRLEVIALDLSPYYLARALATLAPWRTSSHAVQAPAEALPFTDGSFDVVSSVYLLHELPRKIRVAAAAEMARVLKPGGRVILVDSLQRGDRPELDPLLERFPQLYHEPYYAEYTSTDIGALFEAAGLHPGGVSLAFLSKVWQFRKP